MDAGAEAVKRPPPVKALFQSKRALASLLVYVGVCCRYRVGESRY